MNIDTTLQVLSLSVRQWVIRIFNGDAAPNLLDEQYALGDAELVNAKAYHGW